MHVHTPIYAGSSEGLSSRKWEGVLAYIKSVCVFALMFACVHVCMYVQASQTASWYFIVINNRCVCLWQFTQSVCLSHRQTPYCYCLAQRLTQRATQSKNDTEMSECRDDTVAWRGMERSKEKNNERSHCVCLCVFLPNYPWAKQQGGGRVVLTFMLYILAECMKTT